MIVANDYVFVFVPRTGSTSIESVLKDNPGVTNIHPDCYPYRHQTYEEAKQYNKPCFAVLRDPTEWILSMYNGHTSWQGSRMRPLPALTATNTLTKNDILELWYFLSKWYIQPGLYQQTHWIGESQVILYDDINEYFDFKLPRLNGVPKTVNCLDSEALSLAKEIWKDDYTLYAKLKGQK